MYTCKNKTDSLTFPAEILSPSTLNSKTPRFEQEAGSLSIAFWTSAFVGGHLCNMECRCIGLRNFNGILMSSFGDSLAIILSMWHLFICKKYVRDPPIIADNMRLQGSNQGFIYLHKDDCHSTSGDLSIYINIQCSKQQGDILLHQGVGSNVYCKIVF